jgi:hypothetical protein
MNGRYSYCAFVAALDEAPRPTHEATCPRCNATASMTEPTSGANTRLDYGRVTFQVASHPVALWRIVPEGTRDAAKRGRTALERRP